MIQQSTRVALAACLATCAHAVTTITYEDAALGSLGFSNQSAYMESGITHTNSYNARFGSWSGFALSNNTNTTPTSFVPNEFISHAGGAASGSQFAVAYVSSGNSTRLLFNSTTNMAGFSAAVTNTRAAAFSMQNGDSFAKKFGGSTGNDPDWFLLTVSGFRNGNTTGSTELYLADFRFADNSLDSILATWTTLDFTTLGSVDEIRFSLSSSDVGSYGMNTPAYFAMDQLVVPEPSSWCLVLASSGLLLRRRRASKS